MKKLLKAVLCTALVLSMLVCVACDTDSNGGEEITRATKKETEAPATSATTAATEAPKTPTNLVAKVETANMNLPVGVLTGDKKVTIPVYEGSDVTVDLYYQAWPTVCRGDGDTLYCVASLRTQHVDPFSCNVMYTSEDGGKTWSEPRIINDTPVDDRDCGIVYLGNGKMVMSYFTIGAEAFISGEYAEKGWRVVNDKNQFVQIDPEIKAAKLEQWASLPDYEKQAGSYIITSDDYGKTWSKPIKMPISGPHGMSLGIDGKTLYYMGWGTASDASGNVYNGAIAMYSRNGGKDWHFMGHVPMPEIPEDDPNVPEGEEGKWVTNEPFMIQLQDGSFIGAVRIGSTYAKKVNGQVYSNASLGILISRSEDGKTWTRAEQIEGLQGAPAHFLQLKNGAILMTYSYRLPHMGIRGRVSYDGGKTWGSEIIISKNYNPNEADLGYPSTVELDDGTLITTYYQPSKPDITPSVLYTRWRLEEAS